MPPPCSTRRRRRHVRQPPVVRGAPGRPPGGDPIRPAARRPLRARMVTCWMPARAALPVSRSISWWSTYEPEPGVSDILRQPARRAPARAALRGATTCVFGQGGSGGPVAPAARGAMPGGPPRPRPGAPSPRAPADAAAQAARGLPRGLAGPPPPIWRGRARPEGRNKLSQQRGKCVRLENGGGSSQPTASHTPMTHSINLSSRTAGDRTDRYRRGLRAGGPASAPISSCSPRRRLLPGPTRRLAPVPCSWTTRPAGVKWFAAEGMEGACVASPAGPFARRRLGRRRRRRGSTEGPTATSASFVAAAGPAGPSPCLICETQGVAVGRETVRRRVLARRVGLHRRPPPGARVDRRRGRGLAQLPPQGPRRSARRRDAVFQDAEVDINSQPPRSARSWMTKDISYRRDAGAITRSRKFLRVDPLADWPGVEFHH